MDFHNKMAELIDSVKEGSRDDLERNKDLIGEVANHCRGSKLYKRSEQLTKDFTKNMSAEDCYKHMVIKIANAPTTIHAHGAAIMFMPIIADKLEKAE